MPSIFLTKDEQKIFDKLPTNVKGDWTVEVETLTFEDSPEKLAIRMRNMELKDPKLVALKEKAPSIQTEEDFKKITDKIDFANIAEEDLMELYFAMGPEAIASFIAEGMGKVKTADHVIGLAALATIRHNLLLSLSSTHAA